MLPWSNATAPLAAAGGEVSLGSTPSGSSTAGNRGGGRAAWFQAVAASVDVRDTDSATLRTTAWRCLITDTWQHFTCCNLLTDTWLHFTWYNLITNTWQHYTLQLDYRHLAALYMIRPLASRLCRTWLHMVVSGLCTKVHNLKHTVTEISYLHR